MKRSKQSVRVAGQTIPEVRFEDQSLTSFSGVILIQKLCEVLDVKAKLRGCVRHLASSASYHPATVIHLLIVHVMLGWRRLRDLDYYRDDQLVRRALGLRSMPHVSTVTRALRALDVGVVARLRRLLRKLVLDSLVLFHVRRLTLDFDGTVVATKSRNTEGTAIGYNPKSKGCRSYYPLLCTVAQTGQVFDVLHRSGNVHDSNGAVSFIRECIEQVREAGFDGNLEARMDGAHFSDETCSMLEEQGVEFTISVPFARLAHLKSEVESRQRWNRIDKEWSFFESKWLPRSWSARNFRCFVFRHRVRVPRKGPIQLDLFEPVHREYEYKAIITNKLVTANGVLQFHNGRGSQEASIGELKSNGAFDYIPTRRSVGNQVYAIACCLAHNLSRHLQMLVEAPSRRQTPRRACLWVFQQAATFRDRLIRRAGRLTRPSGRLTLTMAGNNVTERDYATYLSALDQTA
jgi:hypothetical protein